MEGALSVPLPVRLLLLVALPAAGWLTSSTPRPPSTAPQTTSHYLMGSVETAVEGNALPGKLPETPLRAEPPSSYKVMCQWMEKLRRALCHLWGSVFPVLFMFLNVMLVGVLGAAGVIAMLKVLCPAYENKGILQVDEMNALSVVPIILYPDGSEKTEEKLKDKTSI